MGIFIYCFVLPAYAGMILDRALADNSIAMTERRSMNDRQFRLNARRLRKGKGFFDIAAHGLPGCVEAYGKRIDAKKPFGMLCGKSMDAAARTSAFARALALWRTRTGGR